MNNLLIDIIKNKQKEVKALKKKELKLDISMRDANTSKSFKKTLNHEKFTIIGEIKRKSPSKGELNPIKDPIALLDQYTDGGACAISVLTDEKYFAGSISDLLTVTEHLKQSSIPVLRKDFIIDEAQIDQSLHCGANAILLIVSVLQKKTARLLNHAKQLGIDAIVEVHDEYELKHAVDIGAEIIGINNRDLNTFQEDINVCLSLKERVPHGIYTIAESAIRTLDDINTIKSAGFDAALIGETLVKADNPADVIRKMRETQ